MEKNVLILAEKPSVAKDISFALDKTAKNQDGYIEAQNGKMIITYAFGHLYKIADGVMPPTTTEAELPFFPEEFRYEAISSGSKQSRNIKNLLKKVDSVVIATDAGREGELIARLILIESGWTNWEKTYRFWTSEALSEEAVNKGFDNLKPASQFDKYYYSALSRQHSDFVLGLNLSRIASVKGGGRWSIGRVQTPILKIICDRYLERENFKPEEYFVIESLYNKNGESFSGNLILEDKNRFDKDLLEKIFDEVNSLSEHGAKVKSISKEIKKDLPPILHSLTSLQQEANKAFGYTAQQTLDIAQALYETHKVLSYPRTDSNYLSDNDTSMVSEILNKLNYSHLEKNISDNRIFNSQKLTDHHALIPLKDFSGTDKEANVYNLVKKRFLAAFSSPFEYEDQKVITSIGDHNFESTGKKILSVGWMEFYEQKEKFLPVLEENETIKIEEIINHQKWTKPSGHYNDSSILKRMEILNLGTPATRSNIIEKLIKIDYIKRDKKSLVATEKGLELIDKIGSSDVTSPEMTQIWEERLTKVNSASDYDNFLQDIKNLTYDEVTKFKSLDISRKSSPKQISLVKKLSKDKGIALPENFDINDFQSCSVFITEALEKPNVSIGNCEICEDKGGLIDFGKGIKCEKCERVVWKEMSGKKLTQKEIFALFTGKETPLKDLKSKAGKKYSAIYILKEKIEFVSYINQTKK